MLSFDPFIPWFPPSEGDYGRPGTLADFDLESLRVPAVQVMVTERSEFSKFGGHPDIAGEFAWPVHKGQPLAFLAQIDLGAVPDPGVGFCPPAKGFLWFFYEWEDQPWGDPEDRGAWRVVYRPENPTGMPPVIAPAGTQVFPSQPVAFRSIKLAPSIERGPLMRVMLEDEDYVKLDEIMNEAFGGRPEHQLFGVPDHVQSDDMEFRCETATRPVAGPGGSIEEKYARYPGFRDWRLLFQIDTDDQVDFMWGDAGRLYFFIRQQDWDAKNFDDVWMILQCS